jgi:hypothetical protein
VRSGTSLARPAAQRARFEVDKLLPDGRWRRASVSLERITRNAATVDWKVGSTRALGVYRMHVAFPRVGDYPGGTSSFTYLRIRGATDERTMAELRMSLVASLWSN